MNNIMESKKIAGIFGSKTRYKLIKLFIINSEDSFFVREITRIIDEQINSVRRELNNLSSIDLLLSKNRNNKLYYRINKKSQMYLGLSLIFGVNNNYQLNDNSISEKYLSSIKNSNKFNKLKNASVILVLGGIFNNNFDDPVDVLCVVGNRKEKIECIKMLDDLEEEINTSIKFSVLTKDEHKLSKSLDSNPYAIMYKDGLIIK